MACPGWRGRRVGRTSPRRESGRSSLILRGFVDAGPSLSFTMRRIPACRYFCSSVRCTSRCRRCGIGATRKWSTGSRACGCTESGREWRRRGTCSTRRRRRAGVGCGSAGHCGSGGRGRGQLGRLVSAGAGFEVARYLNPRHDKNRHHNQGTQGHVEPAITVRGFGRGKPVGGVWRRQRRRRDSLRFRRHHRGQAAGGSVTRGCLWFWRHHCGQAARGDGIARWCKRPAHRHRRHVCFRGRRCLRRYHARRGDRPRGRVRYRVNSSRGSDARGLYRC